MNDPANVQLVQKLDCVNAATPRRWPKRFAPIGRPAVKPIVEASELAAMTWCARIVNRPIEPAAPDRLAQQYAAHFKRLHQTIIAQAIVSKEQS